MSVKYKLLQEIYLCFTNVFILQDILSFTQSRATSHRIISLLLYACDFWNEK